jgi:hypothetical protein
MILNRALFVTNPAIKEKLSRLLAKDSESEAKPKN